MTKKAPYKGLGADSEEKREPVRDIDTAVVDSLKVVDPNRPIREAEVKRHTITATTTLNDRVQSVQDQRYDVHSGYNSRDGKADKV